MSTMPMGGYADYDLENQQLERRRKMAEMLSMNAQKPYAAGSMVGNVYVPTHWTQHAAQALNGYASDKEMERLDAKQMDVARRKQDDMRTEGARFAELLRGKPATEQTHTADDQLAYGGNEGDSVSTQVQTPAVPGDRNAAMAFALGAKNPMLQQTAMADMMKQQESYTLKPGEVRMQGTQRIAGLDAKPEIREVNGQIVQIVDGKIMPLGAPIPKQANPANPASDLLVPGPDGKLVPNQQLIAAKSMIAAAGKPSMNSTIINAGPKAFETELGKLDAEKLGELRKSAEAANNSLAVAQNLKAAINQGVYSGGGAQAKTAAANIINGITGATPKNLPGSQLFNAEASKLVLDHVKTLGANPSNADREFIEKTVPMLSTSPQARDAMINFIEQKAAKTLDVYKRADSYARKNHGLGGFDMFQGQPASAPSSGGVIDFNSLPRGR